MNKKQIITLLKKHQKKYNFLAEEHILQHNIPQAVINEEKSKTIQKILKEIGD